MKAYKIKSLFFLASFIIAALAYYNIEQQAELQQRFEAEMVELDVENEPENPNEFEEDQDSPYDKE